MADTIIQSLRDYFLTCPLMGDSAINVDYLPEGPAVEYSIDTTPATEIVKQYIDGSSVRQYLFVIRSVNDYGPDVLQNLANSGFMRIWRHGWKSRPEPAIFPSLPGRKNPRKKIEAQSTGYLFTTGPDTGKYQIQCRLQYFQEV